MKFSVRSINIQTNMFFDVHIEHWMNVQHGFSSGSERVKLIILGCKELESVSTIWFQQKPDKRTQKNSPKYIYIYIFIYLYLLTVTLQNFKTYTEKLISSL